MCACAAQLLAQTTLRSLEMGLEDLRYFCQTFQKLFGLSPTEYAKQHRATSDAACGQNKKK